MDEESGGLHIIFICILAGILILTYAAIPSDTTVNETSKSSSNVEKMVESTVEDADHTPMEKEPDPGTSEEAMHETASMVQEESSQSMETTGETESSGLTVIAMNNPAYEKHKKGIVQFTHQKHVDEYEISCGRCHHDDSGEPLELTYEDSVDSCADCHSETQKEKGEKLDKAEKIAKYHFEALHANCIGCHKTYNKEKGDPKGKGPAPTSCAECHPKN